LLAIAGAPAYWLALRELAVSRVGAISVALALMSGGGATVWAATHPLPSILHNPGYWGVGTALFPAMLALSLGRDPQFLSLRMYLWFSFVLALALLVKIELWPLVETQGLVQRAAAVLVYIPVAAGAFCLNRRLG
jgi:hypothetical protein